ncbi:MAG: hypothetical protein ACR2RL_25275 [Gammaproteobacteria bacterium]
MSFNWSLRLRPPPILVHGSLFAAFWMPQLLAPVRGGSVIGVGSAADGAGFAIEAVIRCAALRVPGLRTGAEPALGGLRPLLPAGSDESGTRWSADP